MAISEREEWQSHPLKTGETSGFPDTEPGKPSYREKQSSRRCLFPMGQEKMSSDGDHFQYQLHLSLSGRVFDEFVL